MDQAQIQRYEFRRKVEELQKFRGRGTELISVYVPPDRAIAMVTGSLQSEYSQAGNIKSRQTRSHVQWALESILNKLKPYRVPPAHGLAIFVGTIPVGGDKFDTVSYVIEPLDPVPSFRYVCDSEFFLEPLVEMIDIGDKYGLIVIDRKECTIGMLKGKVIQRVHHQESNVPSKHGRGGQSAVRFERLIEQAAHEWFKRMSERANDAFLPIVGELKGILVGGPGATKEFFADQDYLHHEVQKKVLKPYLDTGYTDETGLRSRGLRRDAGEERPQDGRGRHAPRLGRAAKDPSALEVRDRRHHAGEDAQGRYPGGEVRQVRRDDEAPVAG